MKSLLAMLVLLAGCRAPLPAPKVCEVPAPDAQPTEIGECSTDAGAPRGPDTPITPAGPR